MELHEAQLAFPVVDECDVSSRRSSPSSTPFTFLLLTPAKE